MTGLRPNAEQLTIDLEISARITGTVDRGVSEPPEETFETTTAVEPFRPPPGDRLVLEGTAPDARPRTSETVGARIFNQAEHFLRQIEQSGTAWLSDQEAAQWLQDSEIVRSHLPAVLLRLADRGATDDGLHAELVERLVGKRAKPAYEEEPIPGFEELFDPHGLVDPVLLTETPKEPVDEEVEQGNVSAARRVGGATRTRVTIAVARARCLAWRPGWRQELEHRLSPESRLVD